MKKIILLTVMSMLLLNGCSSKISEEEYNSLKSETESLKTEKAKLQSDYDKLNKDYEQAKTDLNNMSNQTIETSTNNAKDELFADLIMQGIGIDYEYFGSIPSEKVAQINITSEKEAHEEMDYFSNLLSKSSIDVATLMNTYGIETLYLKVVDNNRIPIFEYTYLYSSDIQEVKISVSLDYLDE